MAEGATPSLMDSVTSHFSMEILLTNIRSLLHPINGVLALELWHGTKIPQDDQLSELSMNRFANMVEDAIIKDGLVADMHQESVKCFLLTLSFVEAEERNRSKVDDSDPREELFHRLNSIGLGKPIVERLLKDRVCRCEIMRDSQV